MARRRRVEHDDIVPRVVHEFDELIEGRDFLHAGALQLLPDDIDVLLVQKLLQRGDNPLPVFLRRRIGVDLDGMEVLNALYRHDLMADRLTEDIRQIGRRIGRHQKRLISRISQPNRRGAAHRALAHAALAAEKNELYRIFIRDDQILNHAFYIFSSMAVFNSS